jgi:hypothetical protein
MFINKSSFEYKNSTINPLQEPFFLTPVNEHIRQPTLFMNNITIESFFQGINSPTK